MKTRHVLAVLLMTSAMALAAREADAQPAPHPPGYHTHDGFFLRLTPGFGGAASSASDGTDDVTISGGGISGSLAIGGAVTPTFILCAETTSIQTFDPTVEVNGQSFEGDGEYLVQYLGVGGSLYFPSNLYLHGGIGAMWLGVKGPTDSEADWTDAGFGLKAAIGQEWWVSDNWGLGIAGVLLIGSVPDGNVDWTTALVSINFSATYD